MRHRPERRRHAVSVVILLLILCYSAIKLEIRVPAFVETALSSAPTIFRSNATTTTTTTTSAFPTTDDDNTDDAPVIDAPKEEPVVDNTKTVVTYLEKWNASVTALEERVRAEYGAYYDTLFAAEKIGTFLTSSEVARERLVRRLQIKFLKNVLSF
eukprot:CAMPEP_0172490276 /NCGR_PEP_ID=MMETSP1066-20121228/20642_1 /TAXON_ID=671091 /ORGANISM="Coscinodiscus wailesii, Strain CCMP2513" /LENGTH=155 /DNA_ID=CAMNT_0013258661 /DNA_START=123 /DNA_END=587 /DNA_ORIENTATION=+